MSLEVNTVTEEHAREVAERWTGTVVAEAILNNLERGDLEMVAHLVAEAEAEESRQHFYNNDALIGANDVY